MNNRPRYKKRPRYVKTDRGDFLVCVPDPTSEWGFYLADTDQSWDGGFGIAADWEFVHAGDVPRSDRKRLGPLYWYARNPNSKVQYGEDFKKITAPRPQTRKEKIMENPLQIKANTINMFLTIQHILADMFVDCDELMEYISQNWELDEITPALGCKACPLGQTGPTKVRR